MKLFLAGANSPAGRALIEILRKRKIGFQAPADKHFDPDNPVAIAKMITDYRPTQVVNLADFISRNHSALKRAESSEFRCRQINALLPEEWDLRSPNKKRCEEEEEQTARSTRNNGEREG